MNTKFARFSLTALLVIAIAMTLVGSVSATLSGGSTFEGGDGDLAPNTSTPPAIHDWNFPVEAITCPASAPGAGTNCGLDLYRAIDPTHQDDALGQGSKEDDPVPTVVHGSIPPSKDDLTRFYVNKERVGGNDYLYLAWERSNLLGSAHMDFELNQDSTPSANGVTPVRTAGDLLIDFDFGGSGVPVLALHRWITTGNAATDCEASNTLPCWNKAVVLPPTLVEAAVNSAPVTDTNPPNAPFTLDGNTKNGVNSTFGEAAINLTGSSIFPTDVCENFGAATLKSRSSGNSFTSELKDFIAPVPIHISNCGEVTIIKHTDPRGIDQNFDYTSTLAGSEISCTSDTTPDSFTLNDNGNTNLDSTANTEHCTNVPVGSYTVTEGTEPANFVFESLTCTATGGSSGSQDSLNPVQANITVVSDGTVTCTYVNKQQLGAIKVTKTRKHAADGAGDHPHAGVSFAVNGVTKQTDANGNACFDALPFGSYNVVETVPSGYVGDNGSTTTVTKSVTVDNNASCSDNPYIGETVSFHNTPLTDITVSVNSQVDGGTSSTIDCVVASGSTGANGDGSVTASDLEPGTYTCTVVIDP